MGERKRIKIPRAVIFGCAGLRLTDAERRFFANADPLGFILFARNVETPDQVRALVRDLRKTVSRADAPILIDQEGGRVQRLRPPHWRDAPPAASFARIAEEDETRACLAAKLNARLIADELFDLGITVDCAPVLDVPVPGAHDIIGDRAYGDTPKRIAALGRAVAEGLIAGGVLPIIKHIPGHGRAMADSHLALPVVDAPLAVLTESDFAAFRLLVDMPWAMTAHVVYAAIDPERPATLSSKVITDIIRGLIGFDGVLISDDLSMKALGGAYQDRAKAALAAGCDLVLHCNGDMAEMRAVAEGTAQLTPESHKRLVRGAWLRPIEPAPFDRKQALLQLQGLMIPGNASA